MTEATKFPPPKNTRNPGQFGPGIIGAEEFEREQHYVLTGAPTFGPAVIGPSEPQQPTPAQLKAQPELAKLHGMAERPTAATETRAQLPITKLQEALELNPYMLDGLIDAEFERSDGPRKAALRILLTEERKKAEPREGVVARLVDALAPKTAPTA